MIEYWAGAAGAEIDYRISRIAADHHAVNALRRRPRRWSERRSARNRNGG